MVNIRQTLIMLRFRNARTSQTCPEKLFLRDFVINTASPINKNQTEKKNDAFPRKIVVIASCTIPQKIKVARTAMATGNILLKGLNMYFPR